MNLFLYILDNLITDLMKIATPAIFLAALLGILYLGDNLFTIISTLFSLALR